MAKLVDALDLGSSGATHKSSSLFTRTKNQIFLFNPHRPYQAPLTHRHSRASGSTPPLVIPAQAGIQCPAGTNAHTVIPAQAGIRCPAGTNTLSLVIPAQAGIRCLAGTYTHALSRHSREGGNPVPRRDKHALSRHTRAGGNLVPRRVIVIH